MTADDRAGCCPYERRKERVPERGDNNGWWQPLTCTGMINVVCNLPCSIGSRAGMLSVPSSLFLFLPFSFWPFYTFCPSLPPPFLSSLSLPSSSSLTLSSPSSFSPLSPFLWSSSSSAPFQLPSPLSPLSPLSLPFPFPLPPHIAARLLSSLFSLHSHLPLPFLPCLLSNKLIRHQDVIVPFIPSSSPRTGCQSPCKSAYFKSTSPTIP